MPFYSPSIVEAERRPSEVLRYLQSRLSSNPVGTEVRLTNSLQAGAPESSV